MTPNAHGRFPDANLLFLSLYGTGFLNELMAWLSHLSSDFDDFRRIVIEDVLNRNIRCADISDQQLKFKIQKIFMSRIMVSAQWKLYRLVRC